MYIYIYKYNIDVYTDTHFFLPSKQKQHFRPQMARWGTKKNVDVAGLRAKTELTRNATSLVNETMDVLRPRQGKCEAMIWNFNGSCRVFLFRAYHSVH